MHGIKVQHREPVETAQLLWGWVWVWGWIRRWARWRTPFWTASGWRHKRQGWLQSGTWADISWKRPPVCESVSSSGPPGWWETLPACLWPTETSQLPPPLSQNIPKWPLFDSCLNPLSCHDSLSLKGNSIKLQKNFSSQCPQSRNHWQDHGKT